MKASFAPFFLCLILPSYVTSEIYSWTDENGKVHFSDKPSVQHESKEVEVKVNTYEAVTYENFSFESTKVKKTNKKVVMYSTIWCGMCKKAKRYFKENKIKYKEYDVETTSKGKRDYKKLDGKGVPIILVGDQRMNGFSEAGFQFLYDDSFE